MAGQFSSRHVDNGRLQIADPALFDAEPAQAVAGQALERCAGSGWAGNVLLLN
jgi:hypothetical protein